MTNVSCTNPASRTIRSTLALPVKWGTWNLPPLIASTSGSVDQMKCLTPASLAARTAAVACLTSSVPGSQLLVTRKTPCAPLNAAARVSGRSRSASTTSSASARCLSGLRVGARTLNWPPARRARTTPPPCCPVAPTTAISSLPSDDTCRPPSVLLRQTFELAEVPAHDLAQAAGVRALPVARPFTQQSGHRKGFAPGLDHPSKPHFVIDRARAAHGVGNEVGFVPFALGLDHGEREADLGPERAENHAAPAGLLHRPTHTFVLPSIHRAAIEFRLILELAAQRRNGRFVDAHADAHRAQDGGHAELSTSARKGLGVKLQNLGVHRLDLREHLCLVVDPGSVRVSFRG